MIEARAAVKANPVGRDPLEKTDCAEFESRVTKYATLRRILSKTQNLDHCFLDPLAVGGHDFGYGRNRAAIPVDVFAGALYRP
ncbi:MAG: hypothetical protein ACI8W7_003256 [Gammaproteobacteria bacterium]